jgi:hypothetical protein
MKKAPFALLILAIFLLGFTLGKRDQSGLLDSREMTQVGIITDDIERAAGDWARFLGMETVPEIILAAGHESKPTEYQNAPSEAKARLAFFQLDNITVELIEPLGGPSTWQEFLDKHGPGIHHIAFQVKEMDPTVQAFEKGGIPKIQHGGWGTGEYAYMDGAGSLELIVELLDNYGD